MWVLKGGIWGKTSEEEGSETGTNQKRPIFSTVGGVAQGGRGLGEGECWQAWPGVVEKICGLWFC